MISSTKLPVLTWRKSSYSTNGGNCLEVGDLLRTAWSKSSYSSSNGGNCLEVGDLIHAGWTKSSYSGPNGGQCLEWQPSATGAGAVPIRDSKRPAGAALLFPAAAWRSFVAAVNGARLADR
ncbi:DUF397 domain-containing protein [Streptomyces sp. I05A-00742]|uniref:DUF397 domain-containing protein n=1 Tax=Streptomyces sp. I05A-00742 TaxID=2732853 RepID=UPI0014894813|nr:DUF397 domain-containing protein [Streptomyces sp. I05A-00742]